MIPLFHDPHFTFHFAADRTIPRFQGVEAGRLVEVYSHPCPALLTLLAVPTYVRYTP